MSGWTVCRVAWGIGWAERVERVNRKNDLTCTFERVGDIANLFLNIFFMDMYCSRETSWNVMIRI